MPHTWIIDIDGTVLRHNGYKFCTEELLPGVLEFWKRIPDHDIVILMSARSEAYRFSTLEFLSLHGLRFDYALFGLPSGERILLNDKKMSGLVTAFAVNVDRDAGLGGFEFFVDEAL